MKQEPTAYEARLQDHFRGALLGVLLGDATGGPLEGTTTAHARKIHKEFKRELGKLGMPTKALPFDDVAVAVADTILIAGKGRYSDDTQLTIALAEGLLESPGELDLDRIAARLARDYDANRGYGPYTAGILESMKLGTNWREAVKRYAHRLGGSYGNGAAMRVAPVALAFFPDKERIGAAAELQSAVTGHTNPLAQYGARIQAWAVCSAIESGSAGHPFCTARLLDSLILETSSEYRPQLEWIRDHLTESPWAAVEYLGADLNSLRSVPFALWCFLSCPDDPIKAIARATTVGGDSDTIGAMTGAIAGAFHGASALGDERLQLLENEEAGRDYLTELADKLWRLYLDRQQ